LCIKYAEWMASNISTAAGRTDTSCSK
jgi:hypothetical protein